MTEEAGGGGGDGGGAGINRRIRRGKKTVRNGGELMGTKGDGWMLVLRGVTCDGARQDKCDSWGFCRRCVGDG